MQRFLELKECKESQFQWGQKGDRSRPGLDVHRRFLRYDVDGPDEEKGWYPFKNPTYLDNNQIGSKGQEGTSVYKVFPPEGEEYFTGDFKDLWR